MAKNTFNTRGKFIDNKTFIPTDYSYSKSKTNTGTGYYSSYMPKTTPTGFDEDLIPQNNPYTTVENAKNRLGAVGVEAPDRKAKGLSNVLMTALDVMQRPQYMVTNVLDDLTDDKKDSFTDVLKGSLEGLTGKRKSFTTDIFDNLGWENDDSKKWYQSANNLGRNVLGFVGDVALDPTTYFGAGAVKFGAKVSKGIGREALEDAVTKGVGKASMNDITSSLARVLGTTGDDITKQVAKHGANSDLVQQLAYTLGDVGGVGGKINKDMVENVLTRGFDAVNKDTLTAYKQGLEKFSEGINLKGLQESATLSRQSSMNSLFGGSLNKGDFNFNNLLKTDPTKAKELVENLATVFDPVSSKVYTLSEKKALLSQIYGGASMSDEIVAKFTSTEIGVFDSLYNAFGKSGSDVVNVGDNLLKAIKKKSGDFKDVSNLPKYLNKELRVANRVKLVDNGIEFANGLSHVYDDVMKRFTLNYSNPFTNKVTPIFDLTNKVVNTKMQKTLDYLVSGNLLGGTIRETANLLGSFNSKHIDFITKNVPNSYQAGKEVADITSKYIQKETGLAKNALRGVVGLFTNDTEFLKSSRLRKALTYYVERDNDDWARVVWAKMIGQGDDLLNDALSKGQIAEQLIASGKITGEALEQAQEHLLKSKSIQEAFEAVSNSKTFKELTNMNLTPKEISMLEDLGGKVTLFNQDILDFDIRNGVIFDVDDVADLSPASYMKHYYEKDKNTWLAAMTSQSPIDATNIKTGTNMASAKQRNLQSLAMQQALAPDLKAIDDSLSSMALRYHESLRVQLNKQFTSDIEKGIQEIDGLKTLLSLSEVDAKALDFVKVEVGNSTFYAHPTIVEQFNRVADTFFSSKGQAQLMQFYDQTTNILKTLQTSMNPSFKVRNAIGEPLMNFFAGVTKESHVLARDIMRDISGKNVAKIGNAVYLDGNPLYRLTKKIDGDVYEYIPKGMTPLWENAVEYNAKRIDASEMLLDLQKQYGIKTYKIGNQELSGLDMIRIFEDQGLGWSGISKGNLINESMDKLLKQEVSKDSASGIGKVVAAARDSDDYVETWTRLANFIDGLERGFGIQEASDRVKMFHVDYRDLTKLESQWLRRLMPYYTYMRKNLPMQMRILIQEQNKVGIFGHLINDSYEAMKRDNNGEDIITDDYLREGLALPMGVKENGDVQYLNWNLPITDLARLKYDIGDLVETNFLDMINPMIKSGFELPGNFNTRFGSNIEKFEGERAPILPGVEGDRVNLPLIGEVANLGLPKKADYLVQQAGVVNSIRKALGQGINEYNDVENPLRPSSALKYAGLDSILPLKNQQNASINQAYDYRDQLIALIQKLKQQGIEVPDTAELQKMLRSNTTGYLPDYSTRKK